MFRKGSAGRTRRETSYGRGRCNAPYRLQTAQCADRGPKLRTRRYRPVRIIPISDRRAHRSRKPPPDLDADHRDSIDAAVPDRGVQCGRDPLGPSRTFHREYGANGRTGVLIQRSIGRSAAPFATRPLSLVHLLPGRQAEARQGVADAYGEGGDACWIGCLSD